VIIRAKAKLDLAQAGGGWTPRGLHVSLNGTVGGERAFPRRDWSSVVLDDPVVARGDGEPDTVSIAVQELHAIDYIGLVIDTGVEPTKTEIAVQSAIHSSLGSVKPAVAADDTLSVLVAYGESVLLAFPRPQLQGGLKRDLVFQVQGRYFLDETTPKGPGMSRELPWGLVLVWPNPVVDGLSMLYRSAGAQTRFAVYDVGGRLVRRIEYPPAAAGEHIAVWDGRNDRGRRVGNGIYFVVLSEGSSRDTRKLVVLR
jgi:hypothetical protein